MSTTTFSDRQLDVINSRNENLLVQAAAGSGKTTVLVERIIRRIIDDGVDIDKLLVVTFTKTAALEMKERIMEALRKEASLNPENYRLQRQTILIHNAQITTIDSFCLYLVKNHFHKIGLDPSFRVASGAEINLLKQDVVKEVVKKAYASKSDDFYDLVDCYSDESSDTAIEDDILGIYSYAMSYPFERKWLELHRNDYFYENKEAFLNSSLVSKITKNVYGCIEECLEKALDAQTICEEFIPGYLKQITVEVNNMKSMLEVLTNGNVFDLLLNPDLFKFDRIGRADKGVDKETVEAVKNTRDVWKAKLTDINDSYLYGDISTIYEHMCIAHRQVSTLIDLVLDFANEFESAKRDRNILDFTDMEHMAVQILIEKYDDKTGEYTPSDIALAYRKYFEEVMVDEYQDSNLVQEIILRSISREDCENGHNRFMVGDVKQSIYRFRLARPRIFTDKLDLYSQSGAKRGHTVYLRDNYRSRKAVVETVNAVFEDIMKPEFGGVLYDEEARLYQKAGYGEETDAYRTEFILVDTSDIDMKSELCEAVVVAERIEKLMHSDFQVTMKDKQKRKLQYSDIAVLSRAWGSNLTYLREVFEKRGIPFEVDESGSFYSTREIQEIMCFLRVLNNPLMDIDLYATMVSFFGGFTDEECAKIKAEVPDEVNYLWDRLAVYIESHPENTKLAVFINLVEKYREKAKFTPISVLINDILDNTGYRLYVSAMPDGNKRAANVNILASKAMEYAKTSYHGLFHFLRYVELMEKTSESEGEVLSKEGTSDAVSIMTIHKSKGLEFPVCFVINLAKNFNNKDCTAAFTKDFDEGIGANFRNAATRVKGTTIRREYVNSKIKTESLGEEIRVLYVALTRAREKLILIGSANDSKDEWFSKESLSTSSFMGLLRPTVVRRQNDLFDCVRITAEEIKTEGLENVVELGVRRDIFENMSDNPEGTIIVNDLKKRLEFTYPYAMLSKLYTKTSVSELKIAAIEEQEGESHRIFETEKRTEYIPAFAGGEKKVGGAQRGSAYHRVLELIDFECVPSNENELKSALMRNVDSGEITSEEVSMVDLGKIMKFLGTSLALRMHKAAQRGELFKEQPFVLGLGANVLNREFPENETVLIQGVIDFFFVEDGSIVLGDYKTDSIKEPDELIKRYKTQMDYYEMALNKIKDLPVGEKILYSFGLNEIIVVN